MPVAALCRRQSASDSFGADDQTLVEGRDGGARLQREKVPAFYPACYPAILGSHGEAIYHPVVVPVAPAVPERHLLPTVQLIEVVEDEVASGPGPPQPVSREVDVPLGGVRPGEGGVREVDDTFIQGSGLLRVQDGGVLEAHGFYCEGHDGARGQVVVPRVVRVLQLPVGREGVAVLVEGEGLCWGTPGLWLFIWFRRGYRLRVRGRLRWGGWSGYDLWLGRGYVPLYPGVDAWIGADERHRRGLHLRFRDCGLHRPVEGGGDDHHDGEHEREDHRDRPDLQEWVSLEPVG